MKTRTQRLKDFTTAVSQKSTAYDYFAICHSFVNQIKMFNDLRKFNEIKQAELS